jgi:hypothetical protein
MSKFRQSEKNKLTSDITSLEKKIQRLLESNENLCSGIIRDQIFIKKTRDSNNKNIEDCKAQIDCLKQKIYQLDSGCLDDELKNEVDKNTKKTMERQKLVEKKKQEEKILRKKADDDKKKTFFVKPDRDEIEKKQYERFLSIQVPDYIQKNLESMPNNKGYIWKDVWFFGLQPSTRYTKIDTIEKKYNSNDRLIHEIHEDRHDIFIKNEHKGPNTLIESFERKKRPKFI